MGWHLKGWQLIFPWSQGQEFSWAAGRYWNQNLESHPDSLPVSHVTVSLCPSSQSSLSLLTSLLWSPEQNSWLLRSPEDTQYSPTILLSVLIPNCKGCNFVSPSLGQLSNPLLQEIRGMFNQMVLGAIFSELGNPIKRLIMSWADIPKCVPYKHLSLKT